MECCNYDPMPRESRSEHSGAGWLLSHLIHLESSEDISTFMATGVSFDQLGYALAHSTLISPATG